ncbi:MAG: lipase family protein [Burkholderiales bacterium]|nr:lipase family protein [Burkholderiales bacterium]
MPIAYDATAVALFSPERGKTVFLPNRQYSPLQAAIEGARLAYYRFESDPQQAARLATDLALAGFGQVEFFDDPDTGTQAFAALRPVGNLALLAFRGSQPNLADIETDLDFLPADWVYGGKVHAGFADAWNAIEKQIRPWHDKLPAGARLVVTGHSLGGALATLAAVQWKPVQLVTLGAPRAASAQALAALAGTDIVRLVNCCDGVTDVPLQVAGFAHPSPATYITWQGLQAGVAPTTLAVAADRLQGRLDFALHQFGRPGNVLLRELADHAPINYCRAYFP